MNRTTTLLITLFFSVCIFTMQAQNFSVKPTEVVTGTYYGVSKALRDLPPMTKEEYQSIEKKAREKQFNESLKYRNYPFESTALPKGDDPVWQKEMGKSVHIGRSPIVNFNGQNSPYYPPDDNGTAGPNHYMQTINTVYAIYDKAGTLVAGPTNLNQLFGNVPGANRNDGDPIILYDEQADRWLVTEFSIPFSGANYMLMAVSTTNDPTGTWHQYSFQVAAMPDYPKFGIWQDGYYMGDNNGSGNDIYVMERTPMLTGGTAQLVGFNNPYRPASSDGFMCVPPLDNDGPFAPTGSPGLYIAFNDDALGGGSDQLWVYELDVDWTTPSNSTFARVQQIDVDPFNANFGPTWNNIPQAGTGQKLDGIPQVVMNVPQYRNFGSYETMVLCHTVKVDATGLAGIRWYELRRTTGDWSVRQQGTYAPDTDSRWMGSIMLNGSDKIALGYSISSTTIYPSIRYAGQSPAEYANATGILDIPEDTIYTSTNFQSNYNRWGDYSLMCVDPVDDETFWFTTQYPGSGGSRKTRIASFQFVSGPSATTLAATNISSSEATLNGSVNPQGDTTTYYFKYGTFFAALNDSTDEMSAGAGTDPVDVNADIAGLDAGQMYYFRVIASNSSGTTSGSVLNFTTEAAPSLAVLPVNQDVMPQVGETEFYVTSNIDWTASSDSPWCTVTDSGSSDDTIFTAYTENTTMAERIATITVEGIGVTPQIVTVTQAPYPVGLDETLAGTIRIYPNPNNGTFTLVPSGDLQSRMELSISDLNGIVIFRKVLEGESQYQIDLGSVAPGLYHVIAKTEREVVARKLVIMK
ncbi:MAG: T9SS type A sorting domain-containing protein [Bacteroidales bacterium]|nr:T9SS type A sorting domain-containing protein [Bacteroidales bacterium]